MIDRERAWRRPAALAVSLLGCLGCGGHVESDGQVDGASSAPQLSGYVTAMQRSDTSQELLAGFSLSTAPLALPFLGSCAADNQVVAGCCYAPTTPARGTSTALAGTIQVDPGGGAPVLSLMGTQPSGYALQASMLWAPGGILHVTASGAAVPSFAGSLQTVAPLEGVAPPSLTAMETATAIDRSLDFSIQWTPGSMAGDQVMLWFETTASWIIACTVADAAGRLQVPSNLLQNVAAGDSAIMNLDRFSTTVVTANGATVILEGVSGLSAGATFL